MVAKMDFPAGEGRVVTQGHVDLCAAQGHAKWTVDGQETGICPRCGEVKTPERPEPAEMTPALEEKFEYMAHNFRAWRTGRYTGSTNGMSIFALEQKEAGWKSDRKRYTEALCSLTPAELLAFDLWVKADENLTAIMNLR